MLSRFFPDDYVDSVYEIDFRALYAKGYRGIIFDIDNTLVPDNAAADHRARQLFVRLASIGFGTVLLSNNKEPRVKTFAEAVDVTHYIFKAKKPAKGGYQKAMELLGTKPYNTLFIGDQIFTDIWGARRAGIRSILVEPVQKWKEEPQIMAKRVPELLVLWAYERGK